MRAEFVNPFLASLMNVLKTMASLELKPQKPRVKKDEIARGDVLVFYWKCPHFSKKNNSSLIRRQIYITYCSAENINPRKKYYLDRTRTKSDKNKLSLLN